MNKTIRKILCFFGLHNLRISYDEYVCEDCGKLLFEWNTGFRTRLGKNLRKYYEQN